MTTWLLLIHLIAVVINLTVLGRGWWPLLGLGCTVVFFTSCLASHE